MAAHDPATDRDPIPVDPVHVEPRGEFPGHTDRPGRRVLTAQAARLLAAERLERWRRDHG